MEWLSSELAAVATDLHTESDVHETVRGVLGHAEVLTGGDGAGVMLDRRRSVEAVSASTDKAAKADLLQLDLHEGPSLTSIERNDAVVVDEVSTDDRWPQWTVPVGELGIRSVMSTPLGTGGAVLGVLNLYSAEPGAFHDAQARAARVYAHHASIAIADTQHRQRLQEAIDVRQLIGQAQGILMARHGFDADRAFAFLRRTARDHDVTLRQRSTEVINTGGHAQPD